MKGLSTLTMALGLGLASLVPTQADAQSVQGGVSLRPLGKNNTAVQHTRHLGISPARPTSKPARPHTNAGEMRGGAPVNDNCAGAITLTPSASCTPVSGDVAGATESIAAILCNAYTGTADDDVWYKFTATVANMNISVTGSANFDAVVDLRSGGCNGTNIACADATFDGGTETINATGLMVGTQYYVRVFDWYDVAPATTTFDICVYATPPAPANDECADAVIQNLSVPGSVSVSGDNTGATDAEGFGFNTTWEAFTITDCADVTVDYCGTDPAFGEFIVNLVSDCGITTVFDTTSTGACADTNVSLLFTNLAAGTYYYPVLESSFATGPYTINFTAETCGGAPTPPNDECADAVINNLNVPGSVTVNGDNTGSTDAEGLGYNTTWEAFTITSCANVTIAYCGTDPSFGQWFINIVDDCAFTNVFDPSAQDTCSDGNPTLTFLQMPAGTYYYPVLESALASGPYTITFTTAVCPPPPANDDCGGAIVLDVELTCQPTIGTTLGATESFPADSCAGVGVGDANDDVWFAFVATGNDHTIQVVGDSLFDAVLQVYEGSCSGLNIVDCEDVTLDGELEEAVLTGLTIGNTYYVRVFHWYQTITPEPGFTICVTGDVATGVQQIGAQAWNVFPNPTEGAITVVNGGNTSAATMELFDMAGRLVHAERTSLAKGEQHTLNLEGALVQGTYSLRFTTADGRSEQRVVVR